MDAQSRREMNMPSHRITRHVVNGGVIRLELSGAFDIACVDELHDALHKAIQDDRAAMVYVGLRRATFH